MLCFNCNGKSINVGSSTLLAGIVNVTPDSFSDGGKYFTLDAALARARRMVDDGAFMLDIGGESTRPGSVEISEDEEIHRIVPVIRAIRKEWNDLFISVDTWRASVARAAIDAGADIINDITGLLGDRRMASVVSETNCGLIAMFNPTIMRPNHNGSLVFRKFYFEFPFSDEELICFHDISIVEAMSKYFDKTLKICSDFSIASDHIMLDPGIGFGLTLKENLQLLNSINIIHDMGYLSFVGISRKRFLINILKDAGFDVDINSDKGILEADSSSSFLTAILAYSGVNVLRVHEISCHLKAALIGDSMRLSDSAKDVNFSQYKN